MAARGEHGTVRERIREVAAADREAFFAIAFALAGAEQFYGDVEAQLGVEPADALRELGADYPRLAGEFGIVRLEVATDRYNPVMDVDVTTAYLAEEAVPIVEYTLSSGEVDLYEARGSPKEVLRTGPSSSAPRTTPSRRRVPRTAPPTRTS